MDNNRITRDNYNVGRERMSRGEVTVPTYYYRLNRGDRAQLIRQGNKPSRVAKINGLCVVDGHLAGNVSYPNGYYSTIGLDGRV